MNKKDFLYALENAGLCNLVRDDHNTIDVDESIESGDFQAWCYTHNGERLSLRTIWDIIEDEGGFDDYND